MKYLTDKDLALIGCTHCGAISKDDEVLCKQCNTKIYQRKENSLLKTTIFTLISIIFLVPANVLPMMNVTTLGVNESSTILDGIIYFLQTKSYGIAAVIFIASIMVPIFKLAVLIFLITVVFFNKTELAKTSMKYYRIIHIIGKWSMIDIFVVALMIIMVQFGELTTIAAGLAAPSFTIVVIMTILATHSFDTRLLWDKENNEYNK